MTSFSHPLRERKTQGTGEEYQQGEQSSGINGLTLQVFFVRPRLYLLMEVRKTWAAAKGTCLHPRSLSFWMKTSCPLESKGMFASARCENLSFLGGLPKNTNGAILHSTTNAPFLSILPLSTWKRFSAFGHSERAQRTNLWIPVFLFRPRSFPHTDFPLFF